MKLQMLKRALIAYVASSLKAIWSAVAHPLSIVGKKNCDVADYRIYGNSVQNGEPTPEAPIEVQSVGDLSRNLLDKNTVSFLRSTGSIIRTETGIAIKPNASWETTYTHLDLGLMSDYEGQTVKASMELSRIGDEYYGNTVFVIFDSANDKRTPIGTHRTDGDKIFLEANIKEGYTDERLTVRLYVNMVVPDTYYNFNNLMVYTGEDEADYEPYNKYKVPITVRGKNLFSETIYPLNMGMWVNGGTGDGAATNASYSSTDYISCNSFLGKTITLSPTGGANPGIAFYNADKKYLSGKKYDAKKSCTVVVPNDAVYMKFTVPIASKDIFQLEYGGVATGYEPYIEPQTVNIYLDEPLDRVPYYSSKNIVDYIDSAKSAVVKYCYREIYDGTENWAVGSTRPNTFYKRITHARTLLCSHYKMSNSVGTDMCASANNSATVYITDSRFSTVEEFKAYLAQQAEAGTPVTAVYLKYGAYNGNPTEEPIELPKLSQYKGTTVYEAQTEIPPSGIEVQYYG